MAFAGGTVVIALLSLAVSGLSLITMLGQAAAIVVVVAVLASMTLLPALLALCGDGIERLRIGRDRRPTLGHSAVWQRWGERLARRPGTVRRSTSVVVLVGAERPGAEPRARTHRPVQRAGVDQLPPGLRRR